MDSEKVLVDVLRMMEMSNVKLRPRWLSSLSKESKTDGAAGVARRWAKLRCLSLPAFLERLWVDKVAEGTEFSG